MVIHSSTQTGIEYPFGAGGGLIARVGEDEAVYISFITNGIERTLKLTPQQVGILQDALDVVQLQLAQQRERRRAAIVTDKGEEQHG